MRIPGPAVFLLITLASCAESGTEPAELIRTRQTATVVEEGDQNPPPGVPPEYQFPTFIHSIEADAGWRDGRAWAQGIMRYTATVAQLVVTVANNADELRSDPKQDYQILPAYNEIIDGISLPMPTCADEIRGTVFGTIWNELPLLRFPQWGRKSDSRTKYANCPRTVSREGMTVVGGGGDRDQTCYVLEIDHYWYYPETGELEYRYTETRKWCEDSSGWEM